MARTCMQRLLPAAIFLAAAMAHVPRALAADAVTPDPSDPAAATATLRYSSPLKAYRDHRDIGPGTATRWLEANREVAAIGGWRAYAREAQAPEPAASAATELPAAPASTAPPTPGAKSSPMPTTHDHGAQKPGARP